MVINLNFNFECTPVYSKLLEENNVQLSLLRLDQIHPIISGNKWFKLKYFIEAYKNGKYAGILSFGGAYSNHLIATAAACNFNKILCIGIIRGKEGLENPSDTLKDCSNLGMKLIFIDRSEYKQKAEESFLIKLRNQFPNYLIIPEGGQGQLGVKGAATIYNYIPEHIDIITTAVGSATTVCGLLSAARKEQSIYGYTALKQGAYLEKELIAYNQNNNGHLITDYHFGGFGKHTPELLEFMNTFKKEQNIILDFVYTAKMMYGLLDAIQNGNFKNKNIIALHTGGLQGNNSINHLLY
ncbi:MAG TPA: pyridoxal-phosphate dependent enzyme [Edaphocola sp.]|nr:pyridoxal-phosphate dependent enzyme [Edaphocola sp.]